MSVWKWRNYLVKGEIVHVHDFFYLQAERADELLRESLCPIEVLEEKGVHLVEKLCF